MATLIKTDGTTLEVFPKNKRKGFSLQEVYGLLGCSMVECPGPFRDGRFMICDEEGKLNGSELNQKATHIWFDSFGLTDFIYGNVLMVTNKEFK